MENEIVLDLPVLPEDLNETHGPLLIQGAVDHLDGVESYPLRYLNSCMGASPIGGMESLVEWVDTDYQKSLAYIKEQFKVPWRELFDNDQLESEQLEMDKAMADIMQIKSLPSDYRISDQAIHNCRDAIDIGSEALDAIYDLYKKNRKECKDHKFSKLHEDLCDLMYDMRSRILRDLETLIANQGYSVSYTVQLGKAVYKLHKCRYRKELMGRFERAVIAVRGAFESFAVRNANASNRERAKELCDFKETLIVINSVQRAHAVITKTTLAIMGQLTRSSFPDNATSLGVTTERVETRPAYSTDNPNAIQLP